MELDLRITIVFALILCPSLVSGCSRMQCAPIISKCQLIEACRCDPGLDYICAKNCSDCLGDLFAECCSCVGICPLQEEGDKSLESHVKMFESVTEELFDLFTADGDYSERWVVHNLPAISDNSSVKTNCSMAFLSSCVDIYRCESSCMSLGAYGYRWFHVGCCECVGKYCPNFGLNELRCRDCPYEDDQVIDSVDRSI